MSIEITIRADNGVDLRRQLSELLGTSAVVANPPAMEEPPKSPPASARRAAPKAEAPASDTSQKLSDTSTTATTAVQDGGATSASPSDEPDLTTEEGRKQHYDTVIKPSVLKVSQKHGRDGVLKLLKPYEVDNASKIPWEKWDELMASVNTMLEG